MRVNHLPFGDVTYAATLANPNQSSVYGQAAQFGCNRGGLVSMVIGRCRGAAAQRRWVSQLEVTTGLQVTGFSKPSSP